MVISIIDRRGFAPTTSPCWWAFSDGRWKWQGFRSLPFSFLKGMQSGKAKGDASWYLPRNSECSRVDAPRLLRDHRTGPSFLSLDRGGKLVLHSHDCPSRRGSIMWVKKVYDWFESLDHETCKWLVTGGLTALYVVDSQGTGSHLAFAINMIWVWR